MATSSLLELDIPRLLLRAESLGETKLPRQVLEVTLEPKLDTLCIRFKKPKSGELGEPVHPHIHLYRDTQTNEVTAVEFIEMDELKNKG